MAIAGWQIDEMWEAEAASIWEQINEPDPLEAVMQQAAVSLADAVKHLDKAADYIADAEATLQETPLQYRVESYLETVQGLISRLETMRQNYSNGVRD